MVMRLKKLFISVAGVTFVVASVSGCSSSTSSTASTSEATPTVVATVEAQSSAPTEEEKAANTAEMPNSAMPNVDVNDPSLSADQRACILLSQEMQAAGASDAMNKPVEEQKAIVKKFAEAVRHAEAAAESQELKERMGRVAEFFESAPDMSGSDPKVMSAFRDDVSALMLQCAEIEAKRQMDNQ